jgi:septum formation protein
VRRVPRLILASASPRRREILGALGVEFEVVVPEVGEVTEGEPTELVTENATRKALAGLELAGAGSRDVALGVDTEVFLEGRALGKAVGEEEARERLLALSGRTHEVLSGVALAETDADGREKLAERSNLDHGAGLAASGQAPSVTTGVARTLVTFRELDDSAIDAYIASGEWRDRAGAYAIQGLGSLLVERLEGDFSNVVGLPLQLLWELAPDLFPVISSGSTG